LKKFDLSVIIPAYNHSRYIEGCLISIFENSERYALQIIVIDDFSTDDTASVLKALQDRYEFDFYQNSRNLGLNQTLEIGLEKARAKYVSILASDDLFLEGRVDSQLDYLLQTGLDACYSKAILYDPTSQVIGKSDLRLFQKKLKISQLDAFEFMAVDDTDGPLLQSGTFRVDVLRSLTGLRSRHKSDDWVVLLALLRDHQVGFVDEYHLGYRLHDRNTHNDHAKMFFYRLDVITNYIAPISDRLAFVSLSNLLFSSSRILIKNNRIFRGLRFLGASCLLNFPLEKIINVMKRRLRG